MALSLLYLSHYLSLFMLVSTSSVLGQDCVFNVKDYGAIPDGEADNSKAFLTAWSAACQAKQDCTVLIPDGTFIVNPVVFQGPCNGQITFQIDGVVMAPTDPCIGLENWVAFDHVNGLIVQGQGLFDGQGASAWEQTNCKKTLDCNAPPSSIRFNFVTTATIQGITSLNSKFFHFDVFGSDDVTFANVKATAPADSPNTDGIHVGNSNRVTITDSNIATGDDCVSLGPGSKNINVTRVNCGPGHGISIGSLGRQQGEEDVRGITVRNCTISNTENGVRIKTWAPSPPSTASDVTFQDIIMNNADNPIIIDQKYCPHDSCSDQAFYYRPLIFPYIYIYMQGNSLVQLSDIKFINIQGSSSAKTAVKLQCSESVPCQDIELDTINITYHSDNEETASSCSNANVNYSGTQNPPPCPQ
ncbi:hypothetical protein RJ639_010077 [Escallonia herrerae]|uniref:Uncharacterized protein n=1 Tax=Escallonia herrerae TaxID=1293975 RepID=A0AA88VUZ8_9ASTE|nr:hypothetical protein RJ639_010077 [Escallonia herrerae]